MTQDVIQMPIIMDLAIFNVRDDPLLSKTARQQLLLG